MPEYRCSLILQSPALTHEQILDATDALGDAGCTDASLRGHAAGMELMFERAADTLQGAISSATRDVESAGFRVKHVEMERECIPT